MSAAPADPTSLAGKSFPVRNRFDLVVVGGGEAGCAAALLAAAKRSVLVVDEHPLDPGLIGLDVPFLFGGRVGPSARNPARLEERVVAARPGLLRALEAGAEVALGTCVWGAYGRGPFLLGLADRERAWLVEAAAVTVAAGARDVAIPVEGWTLPGVVGARGLDAAHRLYGDFTGRRVAVLGAGEVDFPEVALRLAEPVEVRLLGAAEVEGIAWRAEGEARWRDLACDTVVMAVDAAPSIELPDLLGAGIAWEAARGGFVAASPPAGVSVLGDAAGTAPVARLPWMRLALAREDALVCACEEVTAGDLRALRPPRYLQGAAPGLAALEEPPQDQIKRLTRAGMGPCQGRRCRESVHALLGAPAARPHATHRAPLRPLPLSVLASLEEDPAIRANWTNWFGIAGQWLPHWEPAPEDAAFIGGRLSAGALSK